MKKQILIVIAIVVACLLSMSCGKEGGSGAGNIVGTWVIVNEVNTMSDGSVITFADKNDWSKDSRSGTSFPYLLTFSSDGVMSGKSRFDGEASLPASYEIKRGSVYLAFELFKIVSNNGKTLVLEQSDAMLKIHNSGREYKGLPLYVKRVATYNKQ